MIYIIISIVFLKIFYQSSLDEVGGGWAFNELFINYSGGLVRRGLLGESFLIINRNFGTNPIIFFSWLFVILHSILIFLYFKILKKFKDLDIFLIAIIFSPALIFFPIYENDVYYVKDILTNLSKFPPFGYENFCFPLKVKKALDDFIQAVVIFTNSLFKGDLWL